jgi:hypothetical protein
MRISRNNWALTLQRRISPSETETTMKPTTQKHITRLDSQRPWHALIDIFPDAILGCEDLHLIVDPTCYGPETVEKIASITQRVMSILAAGSRHLYDRMAAAKPLAETAPRSTSHAESAPAWRSGLRQRILVSLIVRSGEIQTELAYANVDPTLFSPEDIDWIVAELDRRFRRWFLPGGLFVGGQN